MGKGATAKQEVTEYRLSVHMGIGWAVDGIKRILVGEKVAWEGSATEIGPIHINQSELFGGVKKEGGVAGIAYFLPGRADQVMPTTLAERFGLTPATCPAFRGLSTIFFVGSASSNAESREAAGISMPIPGADYRGGFYWTANSPFIQPVSLTAWRAPKGLNPAFAMIGDDANPVHVVYEAMTSEEWGMGASPLQFNTALWEAVTATIHGEAFGISLKWNSQMKIEDFVGEVLDHIQATIYPNPRHGRMEIKLWRDDYDVVALREVHPGNARFSNFQRKMWGETANEIVVTWTNPVTEEEETVTHHDLGAIVAQGATVSDSRNYYGIRNAELAARVAARDVRASAAPLALFDVEVDRSFWDVLPGELLRVNWPEKSLENLVVRVMKASYGRKGDMAIKLNVLEDVFSLAKPPPAAAPGTGWDGAGEAPAAIAAATVFTLPTFLAARALPTAGDLAYPEVVAGVLAWQGGKDTIAYNLYREAVLANGTAAWVDGGVKSLLGRGLMLTPLYPEAVSTIAGLPQLQFGRGPVPGGFAILGGGSDGTSEIVLLRELGAAGWIVDRGVLDTVPRTWPVETPVWFLGPASVIADDDDIRAAGEVVDYKLLTRTSLGQLSLDAAPVTSGAMTARPHMPLRPANAKVNGIGFGEVDANRGTGGAFASGTVTFATAPPSDGDTVTIDGRVYTYRIAPALTDEVACGATPAEAASGLQVAVQAYATTGNVVASVAGAVVTVTARLAGTAGNAIALAENGANIAVSGATLAGGANATEMPVTWANRNRLTEDGQVVKWTDGNIVGEYLQETLLTVYRESGAEMFQVRGLWTETTYTIPMAWVQQEGRVFVRFSSERRGLGSIQNYGLWVGNIPQIPNPLPPPTSPIVAGSAPPPPAPEPDPAPDPLPAPDDPPPPTPGGGGGSREWGENMNLV